MIEQVRQTTSFLHSKGIINPDIGVILGTGLGKHFVEQMKDPIVVHYGDVPNFPVSTVESHSGKLIFGELRGKKVLTMQGRFHYYEGYSFQQITLPVRVMKMLGAKYLLISNAAGNLNIQWKKGEMMLIDDHINLQPDNPLRGKNEDALGPRFPDMSQPYSDLLNRKLQSIAAREKITLRKGVYAGVSGPNLETRAEYRFLRLIGADAVGMSTVPEVIVANHAGLPCCAISVLTDDCDPDNLKPVNIQEIIAVASRVEVKLSDLYLALIAEL
jgi:purine-nucleoside phosphorylase